MPDGALSCPYPTPPSPDDEGIRSAIAAGVPEQIYGLARNKPDLARDDHIIITNFIIEKKKRPGMEYIPCALCSDKHPKFLAGAILYSPNDGYLRLIGHVCAKKRENFGELRYRRLQENLRQAEIDNAALDWLEANIEAVRPLVDMMEQLKIFATFTDSQQSHFFREVPLLSNLLISALRQNGHLTVQELVSTERQRAIAETRLPFGPSAQSSYDTISVGELKGREFLNRPKRKRSQQIDGIIAALRKIPPGSPQDAILTLIDRGGQPEINVTAGVVLRAIKNAVVLVDKCTDAGRFFSEENLATLAAWGSDPRATEP